MAGVKARFFLLPAAAFTVHVGEELPRFPRWATRHFGTTTTRFYLASHAVLWPTVAGLSVWGSKGSRLGAFGASAVAAVMVTNTIYHAGTTALFREYSPGLATAAIGMLPTGLYALWKARQEELLTDEQLVGAFLVGNAAALAAVGSLYVDMPTLGGEVRE
jgi:Sec-independent protein secretion pathway component TatC